MIDGNTFNIDLQTVLGVVSHLTKKVLYSSTSKAGLSNEIINSALSAYVFAKTPFETN